ncbi:hypothetical protein GGS20DRAFT_593994 [Poronia punctata]|nr:hypothetical protein GGS20DRAFT_593994 [Poronia punctata]
MKLQRTLASFILATTCYASPTPSLDLTALNSPETELLVRQGIILARSQELEKRASADFSLEKSWNNEVLFGHTWDHTEPDNSENVKVSVTCIECATHGTVTAKLTDHEIIHPMLRLDFSGVQAYASLGVEVSAGQTFSLTLFESETPIGIGISGLDVGVVFFVDLVFSLTEAIDLTAGFQVTVPDGAYVEADLFGGDINDSFFDGLDSQALPVTVQSGSATFKADLRLRVQAGAEASLPIFGIGAGAVIGIFTNLVEFIAVIESTPTCPLETEISWDLNVGAFAHLDVVVDYTTLGPVPTVSTTLYAGPTLSSCWIEAGTTTAQSSPETGLPGTATSTSVVFPPPSTSAYSLPPSSYRGVANYPVPPSSIVTASGPTYTSTYTHTMTRCGAPGVVNCPATYQTEVVVTRTTTIYPATRTAASGTQYRPYGGQVQGLPVMPSSALLIPLSSLSSPIVATFVPPTMVAL